jgi:hypothetical protein
MQTKIQTAMDYMTRVIARVQPVRQALRVQSVQSDRRVRRALLVQWGQQVAQGRLDLQARRVRLDLRARQVQQALRVHLALTVGIEMETVVLTITKIPIVTVP